MGFYGILCNLMKRNKTRDHVTSNQRVAGSNPAEITNKNNELHDLTLNFYFIL